MRGFCAIGLAAFAGYAGCAPAAQAPAPQTITVEPGSTAAAAPPTAPAPETEVGVEVGEPAEETIPPAPEKKLVSGSAAIVWVPDEKAKFHFRSALITEASGAAKVVAERKEPVFVGEKELWVIKTKKVASKACAECELCLSDPSTCRKNRLVDLAQPYLQSLAGKRTLSPWNGMLQTYDGCKQGMGDHDAELTIEGGVGPYYFTAFHQSVQGCGGAHPMFSDDEITFDIETGKPVVLGFPPAPLPLLHRRAKAELTDGCVDPKEEVGTHRAAGWYENGELKGSYGFIAPAPYVCGTGPGHYTALSQQTSDWIPPELESWGKLPAWVAKYMADNKAQHASMIQQVRATAARRELARK